MRKTYNTIFTYLLQHKLVSLLILASTVVGTVFQGIGIGLFVPLLEMLQIGQNGANRSWFIEKVDFIYSNIFHIAPTFIVLLLSIALMIIFMALFTMFQRALALKLSNDLYKEIGFQCMDNMITVSVLYHYKKKIGELTNFINREIQDGTTAFYVFLLLVAQVLTLIMYIVLMGLLSLRLMLLSLALFLAISLIIQFRIRRSRSLSEKGVVARNQFSAKLIEIFTGIKVIKAYLQEKKEKEKANNILGDLRNISFEYGMNTLFLTLTSELSMVLCLAVILFFSVDIFKVNLPVLITFLFIISRLAPDVTKLNTYRNDLVSRLVQLEKGLDLISRDGKPYVANGKKGITDFRNIIRFENISFKYSEGERLILENISFDIRKNEVIAFVGASGSGKSTLIELLLRFYDPANGRILIDDTDLRELDLNGWRSLLGVVPQDTFLFHDTIRNNINYGKKDASEKEIEEAARKAYIHNDILDFAEGYDTIAGDRGVRFSGGQRQRIALARALIRKPQILILDEAMSSLDSESEHYIQDAIKNIRGNCTVIIAAHRFSTIEIADKIIVLEGGRIAETGTHKELLDNKDRYAKYYNFQYGLK